MIKTFSAAKAGLICKLSNRCYILVTINPKEKSDLEQKHFN